MKKAYWIITGLMIAFMLMASIPDATMNEQAIVVIKHLGYPIYLLPWLGILKIAALVTIIIPGFYTLKEWAYAGLIIDLTGAMYSQICVGDAPSQCIFTIVGLLLVSASYVLYRRKNLIPTLDSKQHL